MAKTYEVRVGGWSNSRAVIENDDGKVALEIAIGGNHCPTCAERVRYVTEKLSRRNVQYTWMYPNGSRSFLVVDAPGSGLPVKEHLSKLLDLDIY